MGIALVLWLSIVVGGTVLMTRYSTTPGASVEAPIAWPKESQIQLDPNRPTLLMFLHPYCACSRASLGELDRLLATAAGRVTVHVLFLKPETTKAEWEKTDLWRTASSMGGASVHTDRAGAEARRFHAETSGQTLLYSPDGKLEFQGGLTVGRGHAGDSPGRAALLELLYDRPASQVKTPVFGCGLFESQCRVGDPSCKP
jgi:hypothetical protein